MRKLICLLFCLLFLLIPLQVSATETKDCSHTFSAWLDDGETHSATCTLCGTVVVASHTYEEYWTVDIDRHMHLCVYCGHIGMAQAHTWPDTWEGDGNGHSHLCTICQSAGQNQVHTFTESKLVRWPLLYRTGRREQTCTVCGYLHAETVPPLKTLRIVLFCIAGTAALTTATLFTIRFIKKKRSQQS